MSVEGEDMVRSQDTYVRARIDSKIKEEATRALAAMEISVSEAIRLLMIRVAAEKRLPFELKVPNKDTQAAMAELESGGGQSFSNLDDFMDDLKSVD